MNKPRFETTQCTFESEKWKEEFENSVPFCWAKTVLTKENQRDMIDFISNLLAEQKKDLINQILNEAPDDSTQKAIRYPEYIKGVNYGFNKCNQIWKDNLTKLIK